MATVSHSLIVATPISNSARGKLLYKIFILCCYLAHPENSEHLISHTKRSIRLKVAARDECTILLNRHKFCYSLLFLDSFLSALHVNSFEAFEIGRNNNLLAQTKSSVLSNEAKR